MALSTAAEIEELADKLTVAADAMYASIISAAKQKSISHEDAQNALEKSLLLRQKATGLYTNAISKILSTVKTPQEELITVLDQAKEVIETMDDIEKCLAITALLIELAANTTKLDAKGIIASVQKIKKMCN